jgi:nicotinate-nucleotide adenylyltransferase
VSWTAPLLVFGGTFDPVHEGHVAVARFAAAALGARCALLIPGGDPPHRGAPTAGGHHRAAMLRLAFADDPRFAVDERELRRDGPSYSVDTLAELRAELGPQQPVVLLLGRDAAAGLPRWHQPERLPALCHLLVVARPGGEIDRSGPLSLGWRPAAAPHALGELPAGCWLGLAQTVSAASATAVRAQLGSVVPADAALLPPAVADYIARHRLYRRGDRAPA